MKTLSIRDDVYEKMRRLKREGESFSDVIDRLIAREKTSLRFFFGKLKGSELLESMEQEVLSFRRRATLREI